MNNSDEANLLNSLINELIEKKFNELCLSNYIYCRRPVIIKKVYNDNSKATIAYPSDPNSESNFYYSNRSGTLLSSGQKAYLLFPYGRPDQGWIESNAPVISNTISQ